MANRTVPTDLTEVDDLIDLETPAPAPPIIKTQTRQAVDGMRAEKRKGILAQIDTPFLIVVVMLVAIGSMMVYSTTFDWSFQEYGSESVIFMQHVRNLVIGSVVMLFTFIIDYRIWKRLAVLMLLATIGGLIGVLLFGDGTFGARRAFFQGSYQPGELAELIIVIYMAAWLGSKNTRITSITHGLLPFAILLGIVGLPILLQPDLSTAVTIFIVAGIMFFLAGANINHLLGVLALLGVGGWVFLQFFSQAVSYAGGRLESFVNSWTDVTQADYHAQQAIIAFLNGGWTGVGLGQGRQKFGFLPVPHTDSIFAVIGEELGVIGAFFVVVLYIVLVVRGLGVARRSHDAFGALLASGVTLWIATKALMNIAVMVNLLPSTGVALPFISFGGSSLVTVMAGAGLLLSISRMTARRNMAAAERKNVGLKRDDRGGGTGGHVYPALSIAEAVIDLAPDVALSFVGSVGGMERGLVQGSGINFAHYDEVRSGPLHGVPIPRMILSALQIAIGTVQSLLLLRWRKPQAILMTGGWVNFPLALAAWVLRVPSLIFLPDIEPGLAIKVLRHLANRVATTTEESFRYFRTGQAAATGYPLRRALLGANRAAGIAHFGLDGSKKMLLVFGGSRGARTINTAVLDILPDLLALDLQILHVTGTTDWEVVEARQKSLGSPPGYHAFPYLHGEMGLAMAAADLCVCRSGASTLGELPFFGLPAILVPYPYAWRYQKVNAEYLVKRGAAVLMEDAAMPQNLLPTITALVDEPGRLAQMRANSLALAQPDGARNAARELLRLAGRNV